MEVEPSPPIVAKKLWNLVRIVFFMLRKNVTKSKLLLDLNTMLKRGKLASKDIANNLIMLHHSSKSYSSAFSCRSNDAVSFVTPREYEFSCSNSPAMHKPFKRNNKNHHYPNYHGSYFSKNTSHSDTAAGYQYQYDYDDDRVSTAAAVQRVLEMLNSEMADAASPMLPGFGKSPKVRQLRITDSPFPMKEEGDSGQVDKEAEEFIKKFYKDLKLQRRTTSAVDESPFRALRSR